MTLTTALRLPLCVALAFGALSFAPGCKKAPVVAELTEDQANDPTALFQQGVRFLKTPDPKTGEIDYAAAYDHFMRSAERQANPKASFNAGWSAAQMGDLEKAEKHYRAAYEGDASYERAMFSLAEVLQARGKKDEVVALYKAQVDRNPGNAELRYDYMQALTDAGKYAEAEEQAREILRQDPENAGAYRALSSMYFAQGKLGMAQLTNEKALQLNDKDPGIYNNMGVTYVLQKDPERAIERFKQAVELDPKNFEANMNLGFIALDSGDYGLALKSFQAATAADPSSRDAKLGLAVALRGTGDFPAADKLYREIIKADPKFQDAYFNGSIMHERYTRDFKAAAKYLDDFIAAMQGQLSPTHEVFERKKRIAASAEAERVRIAEAKRLADEKAARDAENKKILDGLTAKVAAVEAKLGSCADPDIVEMSTLYLEQVKEGIGEGDANMARELQSFVEQVEEMLAACGG
jgi:tetratricopeptide (TPR) repeat protein